MASHEALKGERDRQGGLLRELGAQPTDFDCIVTGDLGRVGADLLLTLLREDGIDLSPDNVRIAADLLGVPVP